jgi:aquaporin Z
MVMIFAGGHISGGHFNPAVTLGVWLRGKCEARDVAPYMTFQIMGAVLAALVVKLLKSGAAITVLQPATVPALLAEFLLTFALVYVVLNAATAKGTSGNSFYGLAIGFTVVVGAFSVGNISGGAFNPAVAVGISVLGVSSWPNIWIYLVADFAGAAVGAGAFRALSPADREDVVHRRDASDQPQEQRAAARLAARPPDREHVVYRPDAARPAAREESYSHKWIVSWAFLTRRQCGTLAATLAAVVAQGTVIGLCLSC